MRIVKYTDEHSEYELRNMKLIEGRFEIDCIKDPVVSYCIKNRVYTLCLAHDWIFRRYYIGDFYANGLLYYDRIIGYIPLENMTGIIVWLRTIKTIF